MTKQKYIVFGLLFAILIAAFTLRVIGVENVTSMLQAILGTFMVLGIFLLASELFQNYTVGLISAYLSAFSYWATSSSRIGNETLLLPIIIVFSFYFLFRGFRLRQLHDFIISGFIFGFGFCTYATFIFFPIMLVTFLMLLAITNKKFLVTHWKHIFVFIIAMIIAIVSMLIGLFHINTENKILSSELFFYIRLINPLIITLFLIGFFYIFIKFFHIFWHHFQGGDVNQKMRAYIFLLLWLFLPVFFEIKFDLTILLPAVMIVSTIPLLWIMKKYHSFGHAFRIFVISTSFAIFTFLGIYDVIRYLIFLQNS